MNEPTVVAEAQAAPSAPPSNPATESSEHIDEVMETIAPADYTITLSDGREVTILKCKLRHIGAVTKFIATVFKDLGVTTIGAAVSVDLANPQTLLQLLANRADEVFSIVSKMTDMTYDDLLDLNLADGTKVVQEVWELNRDFFMQTVTPILTKLGVAGSPESPPRATQDEDSSTPSVPSSKKGGRKRRS